MTYSAVLSGLKIVHINIFQSSHDEVINHSYIAFPIDCTIVAGFVLDEI